MPAILTRRPAWTLPSSATIIPTLSSPVPRKLAASVPSPTPTKTATSMAASANSSVGHACFGEHLRHTAARDPRFAQVEARNVPHEPGILLNQRTIPADLRAALGDGLRWRSGADEHLRGRVTGKKVNGKEG